jgi:hypothetical protein
MYSVLSTSSIEPEYEHSRDLEAQTPRLFEDIRLFAHDSLALQQNGDHVVPILREIEILEEMLNDEVIQQNITQEHVDNIKNKLLSLLWFTEQRIINIDDTIDQRTIEQSFRHHQSEYLSYVTREYNCYQRLFGLTTPEANIRCEQWMNGLAYVYMALGITAIGSLIGVLATADYHQKKLTDIFSWIFVITIIPIEIPLCGLLALYIFLQLCGPCVEYYANHLPGNPRSNQGRTIATSIFSLFEQYKPHTLADFVNNANLQPKNIRDIALKLWKLYVSTTELLSSNDISQVLNEYADYLDTCHVSFTHKVEGDFVHRLLTFEVEAGRQQLKSAIVSSDEVSQEMTLLKAIEAVKESRSQAVPAVR